MRERSRILLLVLIMLVVSAGVGAASIAMLYRAAFEQQRAFMLKTVKAQARLLEAVARFDSAHAAYYGQKPTDATLEQVVAAFREYAVGASSLELLLAQRSGDVIEILAHTRMSSADVPRRVPWQGFNLGRAPRLALSGRSGTLVAHDYRGVEVLAAYEPVAVLDMAVVAKVDVADIRAPFVAAAGWLVLIAVVAVVTGSLLFFHISNPLLAGLRQREVALRETAEKYRALVETTEDFVWEMDANDVYTYCSPQIADILGYRPEEVVGRSPFDLMPAAEAERIAVAFRDIRARHETFSSLENVNLHKKGHEVVLETSGVPFFDAGGRLAGYRGIDRDITRRRQAEAYLRESERRFRELIENLPNVAVQGYDRNRRVIYWNDASTQLYGYSAEEAVGGQLEELIIPGPMREGVRQAVRDWMEGGRLIPAGELELMRKDGGRVAVYSSHVMLNQGTATPEMFCIDVDLSEQKRVQAELERLATYDQLTHLPNRFLLGAELAQRLREAERFGHRLALFFIDLDDFKLVNDSLGHDFGDRLLQLVAERISSHLREYDILARFGGDEFVLLMPRVREGTDAAAVADKIVHDFTVAFDLEGHETFVTASIGISLFPDDGRDAPALLKNADAAMYRAKEAGRNGYCFFTQAMNDALRCQQEIATRLRGALARGELALHFQPQVDLRSGVMGGCEALLRWEPAEGEPVSPAEFVPVAEKTDLIDRIGEWVIGEACRWRAHWRRNGLAELRVDINLSGRQLLQRDFFPQLERTLERHGLVPADIGVELTENVLIQADTAILAGLERLRAAGMRIAIDDFGTGYSSLSYLKRFPVTVLKIDRTFVRDAPTDAGDRSIMQAIVAMGHSLGLEVVVEGIETREQLDIARELGCDLAQGFLFHRPMRAGDMERLLGGQGENGF